MSYGGKISKLFWFSLLIGAKEKFALYVAIVFSDNLQLVVAFPSLL